MLEPIFRSQEQAVVYLFARYWEKLPEFSGGKKWFYDIQVQFPDASMVDTGGAEEVEEAIEFEYALSSFNHHYEPSHMKTLADYENLYIVYWDQDRDEEELRSEIRKQGFTGNVVFVCLNRYFRPRIEHEPKCLGAYWEFCPENKRFTERYTLDEIWARTLALVEQGAVTLLPTVEGLYRTIGFNKNGSDFIECDHWRAIHLFTTTTPFQAEMIPRRLFVKPTRCEYISGYFQIRCAFTIDEASQPVKDYFREFYFYPFDHSEHTCFVYSDFKELDYRRPEDPGRALYTCLTENDIRTDTQGSKVISDSDLIYEIDEIVGESSRRHSRPRGRSPAREVNSLIDEGNTGDKSMRQHWWVTANEEEGWHWDNFYNDFNDDQNTNWGHGLIRSTVSLARIRAMNSGDVVVAYQAGEGVVGLALLGRGGYCHTEARKTRNTGRGADSFDLQADPIVHLQNPLSLDEIRSLPNAEQNVEFLRNHLGTVFCITKQGFDAIVEMMIEHNPGQRAEIQSFLAFSSLSGG